MIKTYYQPQWAQDGDEDSEYGEALAINAAVLFRRQIPNFKLFIKHVDFN